MGFAQLMDNIRLRIKTQLVDTNALDPYVVVYPNQQYETSGKESFVRVFVQNVTTDQTSIGSPGNNRIRYNGNILFEIFGLIDQGDGYNNEIVDIISAAFSRVNDSGIVYYTPTPTVFGPSYDNFYHTRLICPYQYDELG